MKVLRRRLLSALVVPAAAPGAQQPPASPEPMRAIDLSAERLDALRPVIEMRKTQLQRLRDFSIPGSVSPHNGRI